MVSHSKSTLRDIALHQRMGLSLPLQKEYAREFCERFLEGVPLPAGAVVAGYWPIRAELNVIPLLLALIARGHVCALPQTIDRHTPLAFRAWKENTPMKNGAFAKLAEPDPAFAPIVIPDVILTPMLAFDAQGERLGYGGGHYDRTFDLLAGMKKIVKIGVAYSFQQFDGLPTDPHDHKMDMIVTERGVLRIA